MKVIIVERSPSKDYEEDKPQSGKKVGSILPKRMNKIVNNHRPIISESLQDD